MTMAHLIGKYSMIPVYVLCIALFYPVSGETDRLIQNITAKGEYGEEAVLKCILNTEKATVHWLFEGNDLTVEAENDTAKPQNVTTVPDKNGTDTRNTTTDPMAPPKYKTEVKGTEFILRIANATEADALNYTCVTEGDSSSVYLDLSFPGKFVLMEPKSKDPIVFNLTTETLVSEEDRRLNLKCVFEVYNQSVVEWVRQQDDKDIFSLTGNTTRDKKQLIGTYSAKMHKDLFDEQNGIYACRVWDPHNNRNLTEKRDVRIIAAPSVTIDYAKAISSSEIYLNWTVKNYNSEITQYHLSYKNSTAGNFLQYGERINKTTKFFVLKNLSSNTSYELRLRVVTFTESNFALLPKTQYPNGTVTTLAKDPVFVPNISINGFTARSMTIGMSLPPPDVAEHVHFYELQVWTKNQQTNTTKYAVHVRDETNLPYMFSDLEPHTTYVFRAKACFQYGGGDYLEHLERNQSFERFERCGDWSKEMEAITMDGIPNEPSNVKIACNVSVEQGYYINLTWEAPSKPNAEIKGYMLEITGNSNYIDRFGKWKTDTFGPLSKFLTNETFLARVADLKPNMNYTVRLMAMTRSRRRGVERAAACATPRAPPDQAPRPRWRKVEEKEGDASKYSLRVLVPRIPERNGPICCYRVYLVRLPAGKGWITTAPQDLPVISYNEAHLANPDPEIRVGAYVTDIFNHESFPIGELILGDSKSFMMEASDGNASCARCFEVLPRQEPPTTARAALATTEAEPEAVTDAGKTRRSLDTRDGKIRPEDGPLDEKFNYTLFVEIIPGTDDPSLYSGYTMALNTDIPASIVAANTMEMALQICCAVAALLLLGTLVFCVVHTRRARKQPPRHAHVELNPIQAALRYVVGHIGGRTALAAAPPELPPVALEDLAAAYAERQADSDYGFQKEFELLQMLPECYPDRTTHASEARENQPKNRYPDIKAYDQTRVKLSQIDGIAGSDYINANYVMGYKEHKQFICAQGPTDTTVNDFWRMIWEGGLELIVMLTNLEEYSKVKCSKYWPDEDRGSRAFGQITVHHLHEKRYSDYIVRELKIVKQSTNSEGQPIIDTNGIAKRNGDCKDAESGSAPTSPRELKENNTRVVRQYHFLMWKDFAAPEHPQSILKFIKRMNEAWSSLLGRPVVVHCSAGVGRTGTLVALDCLLEQLRAERRAAVFSTVAELRRQRNFLVQSLKQYVFVYRALVEYAHYGDTEIPASRLKAAVDRLRNTPEGADKCLMEHEFEKMMNPPVAEPLKSCSAGLVEEARARNRSADCLPYDRNRVILAPAPPLHYSTYINASFIEAYDNSEGYIITQDPLPNTIMDFWRMVSEHNISTIVMLSELGEGKCPRYWDDGTAQYDHISVQYEESESCPYYTRRQFRVTNNKSGDVTSVRQLQYHGWPTAPGHVPEVTRGLAELADAARAEGGPDPTMVLHCQFGTERSALFAALCILIAQLRTERRVDVAAVARKVRSQRAATIDTFLQYEFLHRAILNYAELHNLLEDS